MSIGPGGSKTKAISKRYPPTFGLTAETTKQTGKVMNLIPGEGSLVPKRYKKGID